MTCADCKFLPTSGCSLWLGRCDCRESKFWVTKRNDDDPACEHIKVRKRTKTERKETTT